MRTLLIASAVCLAVAAADAAVNTSPKARLAAAARVIRNVQATIPAGYWDKARCVAVFPDSRSMDFSVGANDGKGVMTCRTGDRWSAPAFVEIDHGKRMFQLGAEQLSVVLLVMNESAVQTLMRQKVTLGADVSVAPGPIGDQANIDFNTFRADVLTYTRAAGLYMNFAGGVLESDDSTNTDVYGRGASLRTILAGVPAATEAHGFLAELSNQPAAPGVAVQWRGAPTAASPESVRAAVPAVAANNNLRARVVDMQQNLDRLLADAPSRPVGTSGTIGRAQPETVSIDRARLEQIRQQLNAILAALNRP
jgi:lipid-binding SYLF domain-containing protein